MEARARHRQLLAHPTHTSNAVQAGTSVSILGNQELYFVSNRSRSEKERGNIAGVTARDERKRAEKREKEPEIERHKEPSPIHCNSRGTMQRRGGGNWIELKCRVEVFIPLWLWSKTPLTAPVKRLQRRGAARLYPGRCFFFFFFKATNVSRLCERVGRRNDAALCGTLLETPRQKPWWDVRKKTFLQHQKDQALLQNNEISGFLQVGKKLR